MHLPVVQSKTLPRRTQTRTGRGFSRGRRASDIVQSLPLDWKHPEPPEFFPRFQSGHSEPVSGQRLIAFREFVRLLEELWFQIGNDLRIDVCQLATLCAGQEVGDVVRITLAEN